MASATFSSPIPATTVFAGWIPPAPSPPSQAPESRASAVTVVWRRMPSCTLPTTWQSTAQATSLSPTALTTEFARWTRRGPSPPLQAPDSRVSAVTTDRRSRRS